MTRLGVAGLGWLGESLVKEALASPHFQVVAVEDVAAQRERDIASRYSARECGGDFEALLAPDVEAVVICTPNGLHAVQAQAALRAGKDVLVQKPLALSYTDALQTLDTARDSGQLLFVDYTYRFLETMRVLRECVGSCRKLTAGFHNIYGPGAEKRWFFNPAQSGGGALTDLGVHLLDLAIWLISPDSVTLESANLSKEEPVEYAARLSLQLDKVPFDLDVSWNAPQPLSEIYFEASTAEGQHVRWENVEGSFFRFRTLRDGEVLLDRETTLREDTLLRFAEALKRREAPPIDARVYAILDQAYGRG